AGFAIELEHAESDHAVGHAGMIAKMGRSHTVRPGRSRQEALLLWQDSARMAASNLQKTDPDGVTFRSLASLADYEACIDLQRLTWGRDFSDVVPLSILKITQKAGGIAGGAFSPDGRLLGFVYGLTGYVDRRPFHWSHMLAVNPEARDLGLGTRLKLYQRELLLPQGIEEVQWTYD